ncbi:hypothetical protein [Streptomyces sp. NPDC048496]|uniref:hypothetical protein n=1 Tax=Streptomyces sp. NPDC048496 TaxID=3365558 RepID=UPI003712333D
MNTSDGWRPRRVPDARAPRASIDYAKVGRSAVRRRARGMTHTEAAAGLERAELDAHLSRRDESAFDDGGRREAELAEWQRIVQLLAALARTGAPDADGDLEFVGRLAQADQADQAATNALAAWLGNAAAVKGGTA